MLAFHQARSNAVITLQCFGRCWLARHSFNNLRDQKRFVFLESVHAASLIQLCSRKKLFRIKVSLRHLRGCSVRVIQKAWKATTERRLKERTAAATIKRWLLQRLLSQKIEHHAEAIRKAQRRSVGCIGNEEGTHEDTTPTSWKPSTPPLKFSHDTTSFLKDAEKGIYSCVELEPPSPKSTEFSSKTDIPASHSSPFTLDTCECVVLIQVVIHITLFFLHK
jgi:hypothetical protein